MINKTVSKDVRKDAHLNFMGGNSFDLSDPFSKLKIVASSCFFGEPKYYDENCDKIKGIDRNCSLGKKDVEYLRKTLNAIDPYEWRNMSSSDVIEKCINECLDVDIEKTLQLAVELRNQGNMRVTPQVIMVLAAMHPKSIATGLVQKYSSQIMLRGDEPSTQLAYFISRYGQNGKLGDIAIPVRLRRVWRKKLESMSEYDMAKYKMNNRMVKTVDVVRLTRAHSPVIDKLIKDELKIESKTWEDIISNKGSNAESWEMAFDVMGHMALLRNVRNLLEHNVKIDELCKKLPEGVENGRQLPFRYYSAYKAVEQSDKSNPKVLDCLEDCLEKSYCNAPKFSGKVISLVDNSGSARVATTSEMGTMRISDIGNLTGIITSKLADEGYVGVFGDKLKIVPVMKKSSTMKMVAEIDKMGDGIGQGTENGIWLFFDDAIKNKVHYDSIFVYSDMQAGHGGLYGLDETSYKDYIYPYKNNYIDVAKLVNKYRGVVNPKVKVFLVQVAGYQDVILPEYYKDTYILGGWSSGILNFAKNMIE